MDPRSAREPFVPAPRSLAFDPLRAGAISGATAAEMAELRFGGPTRLESTVVTLSTTWGQILAANPRRVFWSILNRAVVNAAIDILPSSTFANGILLGAAGGFAQMEVEEDGEAVAWAVFGASESATAVCRILEVMRV